MKIIEILVRHTTLYIVSRFFLFTDKLLFLSLSSSSSSSSSTTTTTMIIVERCLCCHFNQSINQQIKEKKRNHHWLSLIDYKPEKKPKHHNLTWSFYYFFNWKKSKIKFDCQYRKKKSCKILKFLFHWAKKNTTKIIISNHQCIDINHQIIHLTTSIKIDVSKVWKFSNHYSFLIKQQQQLCLHQME